MATQNHSYTLRYFEAIRGRSEALRIMLALSGVPYTEDNVVYENWGQVKPETPLGQLPLLTTEEGTIAQTTAMAYFLADRLGFLPSTDWEKAVCNSIIISLNDAATKVGYELNIYTVFKMLESPGEETLNNNRQNCQTVLTKTLNYIEGHAKKEEKFIFGEKISVADFFLYTFMEYTRFEFPNLRQHSPWLTKLLDNMDAYEDFKIYLKNRPTARYGV